MESKRNLKIFSIIAILLIVLIGLGSSFYIYSYLTASLISETAQKTKIEVNTDLYQELKDVPNYGTTVTAEETGYGRANPFTHFRELASDVPTEEAPGSTTEPTATSQ